MKKLFGFVLAAAFLVPPVVTAGQTPHPQRKHIVKIERDEKESGGWLGITITDVSEKLAKEKKLPSAEGAYIEDVTDESPADSAGLAEGDVIVEVGGKKVADADGLREIVGTLEPGTKTSIVLYREGSKQSISASIGARPHRMKHIVKIPAPTPMPDCPGGFRFFRQHGRLGLDLETLNDQLGRYFGAPENSGVLVREVVKKSAAEKAGLKAGDVIVRVGKKRVDDVDDIRRATGDLERGTTINFEVLRKGVSKTIPVTIEKAGDEEEGFNIEIPDIHIDKHEMMRLKEDMDKLKTELKDMHIEKTIEHGLEAPEL